MKKDNTHVFRESWLHSATEALRPYFAKLGYSLPENIRFAIAFTSGGKRGMEGECWHPSSSGDQHYEIIIKCDKYDPVEILGILTHQLVHALLPPTVKHGKEFKEIALRVGLEGKMVHALPAPPLTERLTALAANLGPIPHAQLKYEAVSDGARKQGVRMLKAECAAACGYTIRLIPKWAKVGLPVCPVDAAHGVLVCDLSEDLPDTAEMKPPTMTNNSDAELFSEN